MSRSDRRSAARVRWSTGAAFACVACGTCAAGSARAADTPRLSWDQPITCMKDPQGKPVRVQCTKLPDGTMRCLVAPNELEGGGELTHLAPCATEEGLTYERLAPKGGTFVPAVAESPEGYARSERGHAYQVKFDLLNRFYLGASWSPTSQLAGNDASGAPFGFGRGRAEMGLEISLLSPTGRSRHDLRILEGSAAFKDFELTGVLFSYDYQHLHRRPAFWLTSFIGKPRVYPITSPMGWGFRLLGVADRPPAFRDTLDLEFAEIHAAWNPWQSNDLYSHVRFEVGGDLGEFWEDRAKLAHGLSSGATYLGVTGAMHTRLSLGDGGLHSLRFDASYRRPVVAGGVLRDGTFQRLDAVASYEGVLFAIDDQPFSLRVGARAAMRDDPRTDTRSTELGVDVGLRFSFWAPPRVFEPMQELEEP